MKVVGNIFCACSIYIGKCSAAEFLRNITQKKGEIYLYVGSLMFISPIKYIKIEVKKLFKGF